MRPIRLRARNFRTFNDLDITFEPGLIGILGELRDAPDGADSNGAGKSSILEAIDIALFGRRSLAPYLTRGGDVDEMMVELTFEHDGAQYRVRRTFSAKGRGKTSVDLERDDLDAWEPLTRASAKETDQLIVETIGLSRDTYRDSSYLRQGDHGFADPNRDPRQRKELLVEAVLGRDPVWPRLADMAKTRRKTAQAQLERFAGETLGLTELATMRGRTQAERTAAAAAVAGSGSDLGAAERRLAAAEQQHRDATAQDEQRLSLESELRTARGLLDLRVAQADAAERAARDAHDARTRLQALGTAPDQDRLAERIEALTASLAAHEEAQWATLRCADLTEKAHSLRLEAAGLEDVDLQHVQVCDHCGQEMGAHARHTRIATYLADATILEQEAAAIHVPAVVGDPPVEELRATKLMLADASQQTTDRVRLEERLIQLSLTADDRPADAELLDAKTVVAGLIARLEQHAPVDVPRLERTVGRTKVEIEQARKERDHQLARLARCDERLSQIQAADDRLEAIASETATIRQDIDRDVLLERCYGRDGIPALIIENSAIPYIETEASRILSLLGSGFQVELRTQAENKTGGLRDTLDVVVIDQGGNQADYTDGCSGGEQTRVGLALRIALARLLAHRRGAESRLLALDEPSFLDQAGMAALLTVLQGLEDEFNVILLVSHVPELRDSLDQTLTVVKENGRSRIEGSRVEVAA